MWVHVLDSVGNVHFWISLNVYDDDGVNGAAVDDCGG